MGTSMYLPEKDKEKTAAVQETPSISKVGSAYRIEGIPKGFQPTALASDKAGNDYLLVRWAGEYRKSGNYHLYIGKPDDMKEVPLDAVTMLKDGGTLFCYFKTKEDGQCKLIFPAPLKSDPPSLYTHVAAASNNSEFAEKPKPTKILKKLEIENRRK